MILGTFENFLRNARRSEKSLLAYDFIMNYQKKPLPCGHYTLGDEHCYAFIETYTPVSGKEKDFVSHKQYYTIQYIAEGSETAYWAPPKRLTEKTTDEAQGTTYYSGGEDASELRVQAGDILVFYPQDAYKAGCCTDADATQPVTKITMKILME